MSEDVTCSTRVTKLLSCLGTCCHKRDLVLRL